MWAVYRLKKGKHYKKSAKQKDNGKNNTDSNFCGIFHCGKVFDFSLNIIRITNQAKRNGKSYSKINTLQNSTEQTFAGISGRNQGAVYKKNYEIDQRCQN
ncbi:MAG: hypothetical protein UDC79_03450, partial [Acutalibacteraceae bacterium]|nr:hypothetical protein [Acutalibacteraceae bacterium]